MIRSILVPLDGSLFAEAALPAAAFLARSARARLVLVHVRRPVRVREPVGGGAGSGGAGRVREEAYLGDLAARVAPGLATDVEVLDGAPAEALPRCVDGLAPDLVVMATHGRGSLNPLAVGSLADHLRRTTAVPLLLIRPGDGADHPAPPDRFRAALVPVDLGAGPGRILGPLAAFACLTQAHVTLLHVAAAGQAASAQRALDGLADGLRARGIAAAARVVAGPDPASVIQAELGRGPADFLVLAARGGGGQGLRPLGAVADAVVRGPGPPVLVLHPAGA